MLQNPFRLEEPLMQYGLAAWGLRFTPLREQLAMTGRLKLNLLEIGISGFHTDLLQAGVPNCFLDTVKTLFKEYSLTPLCAVTGNDFTQPDKNDTAASLGQTLAALRTADILGIRYLRIFAGFSPVEEVVEERYKTLVECINKIYEAAKKTNVIPVVETHGGVNNLPDNSIRHFASVSTECETLDKLFNDVPEMVLNFDPANLCILDKDVCSFYHRYREKIVYMHLKDFVRCGMGWVPGACGTGEMDWGALMAEISSFSGPAMLEYEIPSDVENGFTTSLNFLQHKEKENCKLN